MPPYLHVLVIIPASRRDKLALAKKIRYSLERNNFSCDFLFISSKNRPDAQAIPQDCIVWYNDNLRDPGRIAYQLILKMREDQSDLVFLGRKTNRGISRFGTLISDWFFRRLFRLNLRSDFKTAAFQTDVAKRLNVCELGPEFAIKAAGAGFRISTLEREDEQAFFGRGTPRALFFGIVESFRLKAKGAEVVPFSESTAKKKGRGFHYRKSEYIHFDGPPYKNNAFKSASNKQIIFLSLAVAAYLIALTVDWRSTLIVSFGALTVVYFADLLFNLFLIIKSFLNDPEIKFKDREIAGLGETGLPAYTIFCPLYKESEVLPQFVSSMSRLNYPKDKLQVLLLLEENDKKTIEAARACRLPDYFETIIVPDSKPKTKPKACNYGLMFARGEYSVIFDAEDVPEPDQLKKAVLAFRKAGRKIGCIQAKLNFYNPRQNLLTRIFTAEYSLWFDLILTGLQSIGAPIPLGGTSNHFRTKDLRRFDGWDAFNVTEDCDLGIRLSKAGYKTAIMDSITLEEANSRMKNWLAQRSRWVKGYIQTYLVHMRRPGSLWKELKSHALTFQLVVGGKIFSMFINPAMWTITILYFFGRSRFGPVIQSLFPNPALLYMGVISLIFGNFLYLYYYMIGCAKHGHYEIIKYVFLVPIYWVGMSIAAWVALVKLIYNPHEWSKTKHGFHLFDKKIMEQAETLIGNTLVDGSYLKKTYGQNT